MSAYGSGGFVSRVAPPLPRRRDAVQYVSLRRITSYNVCYTKLLRTGLAVPTFVVDAPGGGGKTPVMPDYLISQNDKRVILRNYEGSYNFV